MNDDKKIVLSKEEEQTKNNFIKDNFVITLEYIINFIKEKDILQEKNAYLKENERIYDMYYHFSVKYRFEENFKKFFYKSILLKSLDSIEAPRRDIVITRENIDTVDFSQISDRSINSYSGYEVNYHEYDNIFKNILFYYSLNNELDNLLNEIRNDIDYKTFGAFQNYFNLYKNENNKKYNLLKKELSNLKDSLMIDFFDKWIFKWEILPNGKKYIKLEKWDLDKIKLHPDVIKKQEELNKVFDSDNYWFSGLSLNTLYKSIENIYLFKTREDRQKTFSEKHNFIDKKVFILSLKEFDEAWKFYLENQSKIVYNKDTKKELEWKDIKDIVLYFYDYREKIKDKENTAKLLDRYSIFLSEKDIEKQDSYKIAYSEIKKDIVKEGVYKEDSRYIDKQVTNRIWNNPELKKVYQNNKKIKDKKSHIDSFIFKIDNLNTLYDEYKKEYILNNNILKSSRDIGDYNDVVLYNNHINKLSFSDYHIFKFRLYNYTEFEFWGSSEDNEFLRSTMIAKDIDELIEKVNFQYNVIAFDWRWDKEKRENNLCKKLWIKEKELISQINKSELRYVLCHNCWRPYIKQNWKCWDYHCEKDIEQKKIELLNKENINIDNTAKIEELVEENWLDLLDNVIDSNSDIEKESIKITINTTDAVIYRIFNKENWFSYVGKTEQNFTTRWSQHFTPGNTSSPFSQDIKEYWLISFSFEILEEINKNDVWLSDTEDFLKYILIREQYYIDLHNSFEAGYNRRNNFKKEKIEVRTKASDNNLSLWI